MNLPTSLRGFLKLKPLIVPERSALTLAVFAVGVSSLLGLLGPYFVGRAIDEGIRAGNYAYVWRTGLLLLGMYVVSLGTNYAQMMLMGGVGQRILFRLRNEVFQKLQTLSVSFFSESKAGDLISRINNDTDKLNQFFAEMLTRFVGTFFMMGGAALLMVLLDLRLGFIVLLPAFVLLVITQAIGGWLKAKQKASLQAVGALSSEVQEYLQNFQVIAAFHRRDVLEKRFSQVASTAYDASVRAGVANGVLVPSYDMTSQFAQFLTIAAGVWLIAQGSLTIGALVSFALYVERFYSPFRQLAMLWGSLQTGMAAWDRLSEVLARPSDMVMVEKERAKSKASLLEFQEVSLTYPGGKQALQAASFVLETGKTYALVGPTGGGKTTTASLMARLLDASEGMVLVKGRDIRSYSAEERADMIGFILQEPYLFSGTVGQNLVHAHPKLTGATNERILKALKDRGLEALLTRFDQGLDTPVDASRNALSLGQRQLVAFMRAVLRDPELLILDEATANIDTVTEQQLQAALAALPGSTTKVVIAHRLNTIRDADEIFFVSNGVITQAGSFEHALELLTHNERRS